MKPRTKRKIWSVLAAGTLVLTLSGCDGLPIDRLFPGAGEPDPPVDGGADAPPPGDTQQPPTGDADYPPPMNDDGDPGDEADPPPMGDGGETGDGSMPHPDLANLPQVDPGDVSTSVDLSTTGERGANGGENGAFRTVCQFAGMNYDDPILHPDQPGLSHLHTFTGFVGTDASTTPATLLASGGSSTCRGGTIDKSAYWVPTLFDGAGNPVAPDLFHIYYKTGYQGAEPSEVQPIPEGLMMIGGDVDATSQQPYAYFTCNGNGKSATPQDCNGELWLQVDFPQCWDGQSTAWDGGAHVRYGDCPAGWVTMPVVTVNAVWKVSGSGYHLMDGVAPHADFMNGWDPAIMDTFVENCINPGLDCHSHLLGDGRAMG